MNRRLVLLLLLGGADGGVGGAAGDAAVASRLRGVDSAPDGARSGAGGMADADDNDPSGAGASAVNSYVMGLWLSRARAVLLDGVMDMNEESSCRGRLAYFAV